MCAACGEITETRMVDGAGELCEGCEALWLIETLEHHNAARQSQPAGGGR